MNQQPTNREETPADEDAVRQVVADAFGGQQASALLDEPAGLRRLA